MLVENQEIEMIWTNSNKKYYIDKGYSFTKKGNKFYVKAEDLPSGSKFKINAICDVCGKIVNILYCDYIKSINKNNYYSCKNCSCKKAQQNKIKDKKERYFNIFIEWCNQNGYTPISTLNEYENAKSNLFFICPKHGKYSVTYGKIKQGQKISKCCVSEYNRKLFLTPIDEVQKIIESKNNNILLNPEDFINCKAKNLKIICGSCGKEYITSLENIKRGDGKCFSCGRNKKNWKSFNSIYKKRYEQYYNRCIELDYKPIMNAEDFSLDRGKLIVKFVCPKHGIVQQNFGDFIARKTICKFCAHENIGNKLRIDKNEVEKIIESKNNNKLLNVNEYKGFNTKNLKVLCGSCGKIFTTSLGIYSKNIDGKCPDCSELSYGEFLVAMYLDKYGVTYFRQEHFNGDCRDIKPLPFDFYLPEYNICIEYDGEQHFEPVFGEKQFLSTILHDGMKNNYCKWNNMYLIRIPYWEFHNIEQILIKELNLTQQEKSIA